MKPDESPDPNAPQVPVTSLRTGLGLAVLGGVVATAATIFVLRNAYSSGVEALLAAVALAAFGVAAYGLIQSVLALVESAGERRRQDREVSERRTGDRARKPRT